MSIENIRAIKEAANTPKEKKRYYIPKKSAKKIQQEKEAKELRGNEPTELQWWYTNIMKTETSRCWETDEWIDKRDIKGWHGSIAHVLKKSLFPSVATHPFNYLILKMWNGAHKRYDSSWQAASKMKVWPIALERIKILYPLLTPMEKAKLPDIITKELN